MANISKLSIKGTTYNISHSAKSLMVGTGLTAPDYAIVAGTNDKEVVKGIVGTSAAALISVAQPKSSAKCSISIGSSTEVNSTGGNAIGVMSVAGVKGYYYTNISYGLKQITLSTSRSSTSWSNVTLDWQVGDTISLVNEKKYSACAKITAISNNIITVDSLPFRASDIVTYSALSSATYTPDDFTIFACYTKPEASLLGKVVNQRWYPRNGLIELGWASTCFGVENVAAGAASFVTGWNNLGAGDFGFTAGRDNVGGYATLTVGSGNTNTLQNSIVGGYNNKNIGNKSAALVIGSSNTNRASNSVIVGWGNTCNASETLVCGSEHSVTDGSYWSITAGHLNRLHTNAYASAVFGDDNSCAHPHTLIAGYHNYVTNEYQTVVGRYAQPATDALFTVGNGSADGVSNAFQVLNDGKAIVTDLQAYNVTATDISSGSIHAFMDIIANNSIQASSVNGSNIYAHQLDVTDKLEVKDLLRVGSNTSGDIDIAITGTTIVEDCLGIGEGHARYDGTNWICGQLRLGRHSDPHSSAFLTIGNGTADAPKSIFEVTNGAVIFGPSSNLSSCTGWGSVAIGNGVTVTANSSFATGSSTKVYAKESVAGGVRNTIGNVDGTDEVGKCSAAFGVDNTILHKGCFVAGEGHTTARDHQTLLGVRAVAGPSTVFAVGLGDQGNGLVNGLEVLDTGTVSVGSLAADSAHVFGRLSASRLSIEDQTNISSVTFNTLDSAIEHAKSDAAFPGQLIYVDEGELLGVVLGGGSGDINWLNSATVTLDCSSAGFNNGWVPDLWAVFLDYCTKVYNLNELNAEGSSFNPNVNYSYLVNVNAAKAQMFHPMVNLLSSIVMLAQSGVSIGRIRLKNGRDYGYQNISSSKIAYNVGVLGITPGNGISEPEYFENSAEGIALSYSTPTGYYCVLQLPLVTSNGNKLWAVDSTTPIKFSYSSMYDIH